MLIWSADLNEGALMWKTSSSFSEYDTATKYQRTGRPRKVLLSDRLWKRGELVQQMTVPLDLLESKLYLEDFGLAIRDGTSVRTKRQATYCFCAPERLHDADPSLASDMWSYMCHFAFPYFGNNISMGTGKIHRIQLGRSAGHDA